MSINRFLKYINILIALVFGLLLGIAYWYAYRPLPTTSGTITAPIQSRATVVRDALGVPHIEAVSVEDALFLQGYVTAQDRLWQMDALRRQAGGEFAEIAGRGALESDRQSRRLRMRRIAEQYHRTLPPKDRAIMAVYARGVNFFLATHRGRLPLEFKLLGYDPRPWSVTDSLLVALHMFRTLTETWPHEIQKRNLLEGGDAGKVDFLFSPGTGAGPLPGSNAWAIAGIRTQSGKPLLASDPHLQFSLPSIWYQVHLKAPGLNAAGVSIPGVPAVIVGHNQRIAWGVTNLQFDVQDLYLEKFNPQTGRYVFRNQVEQARLEAELIPVKGEKPVESATWVTRHGPIVVAENARQFSLVWVAAVLPEFDFPFLDINQAGGWQEFTRALARFPGPAQNFVYADVDGNIGYQAAGKLPIRRNHNGDVPVDGASGDFEWDGFIPFEELPSAYNPPSGMLVTANQNPFPPHYPYGVNGNFSSGDRARQIRALLSVKRGWRAGDMLEIQKDVYSEAFRFFALQAVASYERRGARNPALEDAVRLLRGWSGQMEKGTAAPVVATLLYQHLRKAVAERASPGKGLLYDFPMAPAAVETLLRTRPQGWFDDYDQVILRSFEDAVEEGRRMQGRDPGKWDYGRLNRLLLAPSVVDALPIAGKYFRIGPVAMSGSSTTVKQTTPRVGPSMRMAADLADWDSSFQNITAGQSGQILSSHYRDQWEAYYAGRSFPMQFQRIDGKNRLEVLPR